MKKKELISLCLSGIVMFGLSCGKNEPKTTAGTDTKPDLKKLEIRATPAFSGDQLAVTWDGGQLYISEIDKILHGHFEVSQRTSTIPTLTGEMLSGERLRIIDAMIDNYLLMLEAYSRGLAVTPAEKEDVIRQIKSMFNTEEEYKKNWQSYGKSEEDFLKVMTSRVLSEKCVREQQEQYKKEITPESMKAYYDQNISMFTTIHRSEFNEFAVRAIKGRTMEEAKALADKFHDEIKKKMDTFQTFDEKRKVIQESAFQNSDGDSAKYNYGYITLYQNEKALDRYTQEFVDKLKIAPRGTLSEVMQNYDGYAFFFVKEQTPSVKHEFNTETVQKMVPNLILEKKMKDWKQSLKAKYHCKIYQENLATMKYCGPTVQDATDDMQQAANPVANQRIPGKEAGAIVPAATH